MPSESPSNDRSTPSAGHPSRQPPSPSATQPAAAQPKGDKVSTTQPIKATQGQQSHHDGEPPQDGTAAEPGGPISVPVHGLPVFPYEGGAMTRPKRTQCKNACTNCQKACKKCDDGRPCGRCIRYGTPDTCVDSKRKERKKGVKRGPYKKRDSKGSNADAENEDGSGPGPSSATRRRQPAMPYVGPVGYPPGMWSTYTPGPGAKIEGGGFFQPVFALAPVGGQGPRDGENSGGAGGAAAHFPVGFYPATFISYPGPYPFPIPPPSQAGGFHFAYPPLPGIFPPRSQNAVASNPNSEATAGASGSSGTRKDTPDSGVTANADKGEPKDNDKVEEPQVNGTSKLVETVNSAVSKATE